MKDATVDSIIKGKAYGSVAARLLASGMNVNALRTYDTLMYDEWKEIDRVVLEAYQDRLIGVADLNAAGLSYNVPNGLAKTVIGYQDVSDTEEASVSLDGVTRGERDRPEFDINYLPLPIIHKDFSFTAREIASSREGTMPLDTTQAQLSARKVAEKVEEMYFTGHGTYTFGGGTIYGLMDEPNRNVGNMAANWDTSAGDGESILGDVLAMKQAGVDDRCYGPYNLYIPTNYETAIDEDFKANSDKSIRERLLQIDSLNNIKVADKLTDDNVILVQMTVDVVRVVNGMAITTVQWETEGGMRLNFKVMAIQIPHIRHDQTGRCGVMHWT